MASRSFYAFLALLGLIFSLAACNAPGGASGNTNDAAGTAGTTQTTDPATPLPTGIPRTWTTDALLFNGTGSWSDEEVSLKSILTSHGATVREVTSAELEAMSVDELATYGMLVFPGGSGGSEAGSLSADAHARLREAVQVRGLGYIGFCAGAWIAVAPAPAPGQDVSYGFGLFDGPVLGYYYLTDQGVECTMTLESFPDGSTRDLLWYGGPITPNVKGGVIAKYPDGNPAISQVRSGNGFLILSGPHPAASQAVRDSFGLTDTDGLDFDFAWQLLNATLHQTPLQSF